MAPVAAEQIIPAVIVIVAHADARAPTGPAQSGFFGNVRKCAIAVILEKMLGGRLAIGVGLLAGEAVTVGQVDVDPAILVVIEEGQPAALGFHDVFLALDAAPYVRHVQAGLFGYIHEGDGGRLLRVGNGGGLEQGSSRPPPQWSC